MKLSTADSSFSVAGQTVKFTVIPPAGAAGTAVGADEAAIGTTYNAIADDNGIATATLMLGDAAGSYVVQAASPLSVSAPVTFTATALKPASVAVLKD